MQLFRLRLRNFRCYQQEISVDFADITALIGKNDAGKSTIFEALDVFLNDGTPDKDDASKGGEATDLTIICEFSDLPSSIVIDDANPTSLADEYLLNSEGRLELHKNYSGHLASPKLAGVFTYADHPNADGVSDLLQLNNAALKKRAKELGVELADIDPKVNAKIRARIRGHVGDLKQTLRLVPLNEDNARTVWAGLKVKLPAFALFKSDRASTDQDPEAQDPLKAAVREAIKAKQAELDAIASHVEKEVRKIAKATLEKLSDMDPSLASQLNPQFAAPKWESLFKASITGDNDIPINKRGSGVKRLILLNFFRAKAEQLTHGTDQADIIYGIEEPETSQHPSNQRMLLRALADLSCESQVIVSTHTPMLARSLPDASLRYINVKADGFREILVGGNATNRLFAKALGVLPDNSVALFIGVEGKHDINFLRAISRVLTDEGVDVPDLEQLELDGRIIFFPLGGSTLALWTCRLEQLNRPEFHLYDRDKTPPNQAKYESEVNAVNNRNDCKARSTAKREIENYLHWKAIKQAYDDISIALPIKHNFADFDDVPQKVAEMVHAVSGSQIAWRTLDEAKKKNKEGRAKRVLNSQAPRYMSKQLLDEIDPAGDLLEWFADMKRLIAKVVS
jgi:putative ATP-dependent endonuclease of the OLD family